ncbi:putative transcription factor Hap3/NF-YB family [Helianthus annuus]|nr:putative transcription factor Hap3/NF-YB family [Helianthus annuus]KAJ0554620.1 putative transcription factor Hap3/NF-YB family [Helianthus annuus]KAJ0902798.1 putative transcription factor Hap3/NF-YB family [Helianthus annuus]
MDPVTTEDCFDVSDTEKEDDEEEATAHLRDRFRISTISIAESEAKRNNLEISQSVIVCISDLAFKYAEQLADDLELFAHHANRKIVNMNDVILSAHRNKHLADTLRAFSHDLKAKEPHSEKKRKKSSNKEDKGFPSVHHIDP